MSEASFALEAARARAIPAMAARALCYLLCADMRRQEATFDDPRIDELLWLERTRPDGIPELRVFGVRVAAQLLGIRRFPPSPSLVRPQTWYVAPLYSQLFQLAQRFVGRPAWTQMPSVEMVGDPTAWRVGATPDRLLWQAATACAAGDAAAAASILRRFDSPVEFMAQSVLVATRLPVLANVAREIGDRDLAAQLLEANLAASGTDLSMLPGGHFGPVDSWLAALADVAGDDRAAKLHEQATRRLTELGAYVMETA